MSDATNETELKELFGAPARSIEPDNDQLEVQLALRTIRDYLMAAAELDDVEVNQLARRLCISPSSVSRFLGGEGDFHVSTMVLYTRALGRGWIFDLHHDSTCTANRNHSGRPEISQIGTIYNSRSRRTPFFDAAARVEPRREEQAGLAVQIT